MSQFDLNMMLPLGGVLSSLLACNLWFVRRLVVKIDSIDKTVTEKFPVQALEISNILKQIKDLESELRQLVRRFEDVSHLRERISLLEAYFKDTKKSKNAT